jgi:bifunctional UDP-N-acetylglucosamine pyrophosphorylase/glucosamine-1-phosphate N-acetyltransferase
MKTIMIAAGKSSRMNPLSDKNLLNFMGKPLILHLLENLKKGGLGEFIIVANEFNKEEISRELQKHNFPATITIQPNLDDGMAGAVLAGLELIKENEKILIHNAQDFVDSDIYSQILENSRDFDGAILAKKVDTYFPGGYLEVDENNKILSIIEKPGEGNEPSDLVNIVAHFFKNSRDLHLALLLVKSAKDDVYEVALQSLFSTKNFLAIEYSGEWQAIKFPHHVLDMMEHLLSKQEGNCIANSAKISPTAVLNGEGIYIEEGVIIFDHACISGPCFIGKNSVVGNNALVRESIIGEGCEIGFCSEIARSFLSNNVSAHHSYIGDSVIGSNVNFGAFSVTTNLRLDHKNIKIKVKEDLIDTGKEKFGCIVGEGSQIGSGAKILPGRTLKKGTHLSPNEVFEG